MNWLNRLMDDIDLELIIDRVELDIKHEEFYKRDAAPLAERAERLRKARSDEMIARMEQEERMKLRRIQSK